MIDRIKPRTGKHKVVKKKNTTQARKKVARETRSYRIDKRILIAVVIFLTLTGLAQLLPKEEILPIKNIRLSGEFNHLQTKGVEQHLEKFLGRGFFSVDILAIQQTISQQPWVRSISIRRLWPDKLSVEVTEKQAFARWDDKHLLSTEGNIFKANTAKFKSLPIINGYSGQSRSLLKRYLEIQQQLAIYDIKLSEIREDGKGALSLLLNNSLSVSLGSDNNGQKIKHFLAVYAQQINPRADNIRYIDFRYSNGFAIAWEKEIQPQNISLNRPATTKRGNNNV